MFQSLLLLFQVWIILTAVVALSPTSQSLYKKNNRRSTPTTSAGRQGHADFLSSCNNRISTVWTPTTFLASSSSTTTDTQQHDDPWGPLTDGESIQVQGSPSRSKKQPHKPAPLYTIKRYGHVYYCTCPAWKFQKRPNTARTCKHIDALRVGYPPLVVMATPHNSTTESGDDDAGQKATKTTKGKGQKSSQ